ncbi:monooxygenase [Planctomycetaceae bacterium SCGC AG-212-D15]|nr:monooxygenase [Planctomycetaceae bacterium SCGC AG-212-D15]
MSDAASPGSEEVVHDVQQTGCVVVGGGPAGVVLSLLLARKNIAVTLLEAHKDFDRDFRGDTVHPSTLEILDQLGLADRLLQIPHGELRQMRATTPSGTLTMLSFAGLKTRFPFVAVMPQSKFLDFLIEEAKKFPNFRLELGANVQRLVREDGAVKGVRYRGADAAWHEVRAPLTVGADGRFSKLRSLAGFEPVKSAPPMDVLWFRLPRKPEDKEAEGEFYIHGGRFAVAFQRPDEWQVGYVITKGNFAHVKAEGIEALRKGLVELVPWIGDRVEQLQDWKQIVVLSVESSRLPCWHQPGLLLIGDAAHVMSPVGGVGINYAIQDAVETANMLAAPLKEGKVTDAQLAAVQKVREWPVKVIQKVQGLIQEQIVKSALAGTFKMPWIVRAIGAIPLVRTLPGRLIGFGIRRVRVEM